jgi:hypothetical protein
VRWWLAVGEAVPTWRQGDTGTLLPAQFCHEPKSALKNKVFFKGETHVLMAFSPFLYFPVLFLSLPSTIFLFFISLYTNQSCFLKIKKNSKSYS